MLGLVNVNHNNAASPALGSTTDTRPTRGTFISSDNTPTESTLREQQQEDEQEQEQPQQDIDEFWDAFEDFDDAQIPQSCYDAEEVESTEPRRTEGWFSRWFGSASRG